MCVCVCVCVCVSVVCVVTPTVRLLEPSHQGRSVSLRTESFTGRKKNKKNSMSTHKQHTLLLTLYTHTGILCVVYSHTYMHVITGQKRFDNKLSSNCPRTKKLPLRHQKPSDTHTNTGSVLCLSGLGPSIIQAWLPG